MRAGTADVASGWWFLGAGFALVRGLCGLVATLRLWPGIAGLSGLGRVRVAVLWTRFLTPRAGIEQEVSLLLISL